MVYLYYGDNACAMRLKIGELVDRYPPTAVTRLAAKEVSVEQIADYLGSPSMFDESRLLVLEGKPDVKGLDLSIAVANDNSVSILIFCQGTIKSSELLHKTIKEIGGQIEIFEEEPERGVFSFLDAVGNRQRKRAMSELDKLLSGGKDAIYLQSMLVWQYRNIIAPEQAKGFVQKKSLQMRNLYSEDELVKVYLSLFQLEVQLKTDKGDPKALIEDFVIKITK